MVDEEESKTMSTGKDGMVDHHGELLPHLSVSSSKMRYSKLLETAPPNFDKKYPGSPFWTEMALAQCRFAMKLQFRNIHVTGKDLVPADRGSLCAAWHTNGFLDPIGIFLNHPRKFVAGGRHDLVHRPFVGFWSKKIALQPVVRQAELIRGGCTKEEARNLNGRSLLYLSKAVAQGHTCALFPEGTSHDESHLIRMKTGPMRTVLSAAALSKSLESNPPVLIPVGLHYRIRHHFRTDYWLEFREPIEVPTEGIGSEEIELLKQGEWIEPEKETVFSLRDELEVKLKEITPGAKTWKEYNSWKLLSHLDARLNNSKNISWPEEVIGARKFRDIASSQQHEELFIKSYRAAEILDKKGLDGRDLDISGSLKKDNLWLGRGSRIVPWILGLCLMPYFLYSSGIHFLLAKYLGDKTVSDEGIDARCSYHLVVIATGYLVFSPILAIALEVLIYCYGFSAMSLISISLSETSSIIVEILCAILLFTILMFSFRITAHLMAKWYDIHTDIQRLTKSSKLSKSTEGSEFERLKNEIIELLKEINQQLS